MPTIKTPRNSAKTCPKLTKTSKRYDKHRFGTGSTPISMDLYYGT